MVFFYYVLSIVSIYYCDKCKDSIGIGRSMMPEHLYHVGVAVSRHRLYQYGAPTPPRANGKIDGWMVASL